MNRFFLPFSALFLVLVLSACSHDEPGYESHSDKDHMDEYSSEMMEEKDALDSDTSEDPSASRTSSSGSGAESSTPNEDTSADEESTDEAGEEATAPDDESEAPTEEIPAEEVNSSDEDTASTPSAEDLGVVWTGIAILEAVEGASGSGVARSVAFEDETYTHSVGASLPEIDQENFFYEGWIVRDGGESVISTGEMISQPNGTFQLAFSAETDYQDHSEVIITLEPRDGDPAPADHVIQGILETQ